MLSHFHFLGKHHLVLLELKSSQKACHTYLEFTDLRCTLRILAHELSAGSPPFPTNSCYPPHMGQFSSSSWPVLKSLYPSITELQRLALPYHVSVIHHITALELHFSSIPFAPHAACSSAQVFLRSKRADFPERVQELSSP